ncbi:phage tail tape measure protein [Aporhodopirellula aestuarii]|uniref:Phage tail tape measure protein n=1 Tax=Aporhodopirellula aestuarii TaxID=2950107 RepID=A0ABT0TYT1_9BACT|nr:hypothetical protein [Aporhodopirellula aestuarii]MCM2369641.1 hypothetical protein [Aporhodopirellula aestuarii]
MSKNNIKAGSAYVEIGIRNRLAKGAKEVQADLNKLAKSTTANGLKLVAAASATLAPITAAAFSFASSGDQLDKMSKRTGISVEALSQLGFAAEQSGSDLGVVEKGVRGMQRSLYDAGQGSTEAIDALAQLGLTASDLSGMLPEDQFTILADKIATIEDPSKRAALAMKLFGRSGSDLLPLFGENAKGIANLRAEADALGRTMSTEDATAAAAFTDSMNRLKSVMTGVKNQIGAAVAPAFTRLAELVLANTSGISVFLSENRGMIVGITAAAAAVGAGGAALVTLGGVLAATSVAIGGVAATAAFLVSPLGIATAAAAGLGFALVKYTSLGSDSIDWLSDRFGGLVEMVQGSIGAISDAVRAGDMDKAWELTVSLMELVWLDLTGGIRDAWADTMNWLLDASSTATGQIGKMFQSLSGLLTSLLDKYKSVYDTIYNFTEETLSGAANSLTGVETIGGRSEPRGSAFERQYGDFEASVRNGIESIRYFGESLEDEANNDIAERSSNAGTAREAREARIAELQASLAKANEEAAATRANAPASTEEATPAEPEAPDFSGMFADLQKQAQVIPEQTEMESGPKEEQQPQSSGPTATFSAFAASIIGRGQSPNQRMLSLTDRIAKASEQTAKAVQGLDGAGDAVAGAMPDANPLEAQFAMQAIENEARVEGVNQAMVEAQKNMDAGGGKVGGVGNDADRLAVILESIDANTAKMVKLYGKSSVARFT